LVDALAPSKRFTALMMIDRFYKECAVIPDLVPVTSYNEIVDAKKQGKVTGLLSIEGADIIVNISAAPAIGKAYSRWGRASFETVIPARAMENTVFFVYANLVGIENNILFCGGSEIAAPNGEQICKAKYDEEDFLTVKLDLSKIEKTRRSFTFLTHIRPELYDRIADRIRKI